MEATVKKQNPKAWLVLGILCLAAVLVGLLLMAQPTPTPGDRIGQLIDQLDQATDDLNTPRWDEKYVLLGYLRRVRPDKASAQLVSSLEELKEKLDAGTISEEKLYRSLNDLEETNLDSFDPPGRDIQ